MARISSYKILLPVTKVGLAEDTIRIASAMIESHQGRLVVLGTVEIPPTLSLSFGAIPARRYRRLLKRFAEFGKAENVEMRTLVKVSRQAWEGIIDAAYDEKCNLIMLGWDGSVDTPSSLYGATIDEIARKAPRDLLIVRPGKSRKFKRILVPLRGKPHARLTLDVAISVAKKFKAKVTVMHILREGSSDSVVEKQRRSLATYLEKSMQSDVEVEVLAVCSRNVAQAIIETSKNFDLVVIGATLIGDSVKAPVGPIPKAIADQTSATLIIAQSVHPSPERLFAQTEVFKKASEISEIVDKWFAENTFHASEFADIGELISLKEKKRFRISLGLPALNEAKTIGKIITCIKSELQDKYSLLDEIVVIDSGSTDGTVKIAKESGALVYNDKDILPSQGGRKGKGEALWKSLYILNGDVIVWIDTDIRNIHPKFIYGLVGPILKYPRIKYVKGFYRRPIKVGQKLIETGGGRVTELTARPLINLFFPELSGLVQPLSGEYAGKREVLEQLCFYSGYGVELGLLIDILRKFGLSVIGQVDLSKRIHRNQSLIDLSKMAFAIIQVAIEQLEEKHDVKLLQAVNRTMKLIHHEPKQFYLKLESIEEEKRPPIISIPEYVQKFSQLPSRT
jgi:glucosyl-3-phosphoglycerate synthase